MEENELTEILSNQEERLHHSKTTCFMVIKISSEPFLLRMLIEPQLFTSWYWTLSATILAPETDFAEDNSSKDQAGAGVGGCGLGMLQAHDIYCALYFYYSYISSISDHQAIDPRG